MTILISNVIYGNIFMCITHTRIKILNYLIASSCIYSAPLLFFYWKEYSPNFIELRLERLNGRDMEEQAISWTYLPLFMHFFFRCTKLNILFFSFIFLRTNTPMKKNSNKTKFRIFLNGFTVFSTTQTPRISRSVPLEKRSIQQTYSIIWNWDDRI